MQSEMPIPPGNVVPTATKSMSLKEITEWIEANVETLIESIPHANPPKLIRALHSLDEMIGMDETKTSIIDQLCFLLDNGGRTDGHFLHTLVAGPPGVGKCLAQGTMVRIYGKSLPLPVEEIRKGDMLVGDDETPRIVLSTCIGIGPLHRIYRGQRGDYWVNSEHILSVVNCHEIAQDGSGRVEYSCIKDIPLPKIIALPDAERENLRGVERTKDAGFRAHIIHIETKSTKHAPYFGFELDGNGRFLLADGTITHNTSLGLVLADIWDALSVLQPPASSLNRQGKLNKANKGTFTELSSRQKEDLYSLRETFNGSLAHKDMVLGSLEYGLKQSNVLLNDAYQINKYLKEKTTTATDVDLSDMTPVVGVLSKRRKRTREEDYDYDSSEDDYVPKKKRKHLDIKYSLCLQPSEAPSREETPRSSSLVASSQSKPTYQPTLSYLSNERVQRWVSRVIEGMHEMSDELTLALDTLSSLIDTEKKKLLQTYDIFKKPDSAPPSQVKQKDKSKKNKGGPTLTQEKPPFMRGTFAPTKVLVASRVDFVAGYLGQSAIKTRRLLESCEGGVLIVEESYSLYQGERDSFGAEVIHVLNQWMSEKPNSVIFVFLGYKDMIENTIFKANEGLRRRFGWSFEINPYNAKQLAQIFRLQMDRTAKGKSTDSHKTPTKVHWTLDAETDGKLESFLGRNLSNFKHYGGDTDKLLFQCKLSYGRRKWKQTCEDADNRVGDSGSIITKIITWEMLEEAMEKFKIYSRVREGCENWSEAAMGLYL